MNYVKQQSPLFVPFQDRHVSFEPSKKEKLYLRAVVTSLVVFIFSVTLISFLTNKFEEKVREAQMAAKTCKAPAESAATLSR